MKRKKSSEKNINFLTCSGVPALGPGLDKEARDEGRGTRRREEASSRSDEEIKREIEIDTVKSEKERFSLFASHQKHSPPNVKTPRPRPQRLPPQADGGRATPHAPRPAFFRWFLIGFIILVLAFLSPAIVALVRAGVEASAAKRAIKSMAQDLERHDLAGAQDSLEATTQHVQSAKEALGSAGYWRDIPGAGTQIRALEDASDSGLQALSAAQSLLDVVNQVVGASQSGEAALAGTGVSVSPDRSFQDLSPDEKRSMLARLDRALPDLKAAEAKIDIAVDAWNRIPQDKLIAPIKSAFAPIAEGLPRLKQTIDEAEPLLEAFVPLAGYPKPITYLILLQNTTEIRPTGGFIGTVGRLTIDAGDVKEFAFQDVYAIDNPISAVWKDVPPAPIKQYLAAPVWYFRDSNWSPDFPTSANRLLDVYARELATAGVSSSIRMPDAIVAINPPLFTELMRMVGPVNVDGLTFDSTNYFNLLEYQVEEAWLEKGLRVEQRKDILKKLGDEVFRRLAALPASRWPDLIDAITKSLNQKQTMVYAQDPNILATLDSFGWTGRVKATDDDYLAVIDANLAALKTDGVMEKNVTYSLDAKDPQHPVATVKLSYTNHATRLATGASDNFLHTRYRSYTRVYVPEGATLISSSGSMKDDRYRTGGKAVAGTVDVMRELGKTVFGTFWSIEPNTSQTLSFTYSLPPSVVDNLKNGSYSLDWQKQSGNDAAGLTLDLSFGKNLKSATPAEDKTEWGDASYRIETNSQLDRRFDLTF